jgi:ribosomal protein L30/L7E
LPFVIISRRPGVKGLINVVSPAVNVISENHQ